MDRLTEAASRRLWQSVASILMPASVFVLVFVQAGMTHAADTTISIDNAWSRATPKGVEVAVDFATIKNNSDQAERLVSATTEIAGKTQIHQMTMEGGVMKMREVTDGLPVPANTEVVLKPGSYHLMLMDVKQPLKEGDHFSGTLTFEKAGPITVVFEVKSIGATEANDSHQAH
jgi:copper(I)-binding protein